MACRTLAHTVGIGGGGWGAALVHVGTPEWEGGETLGRCPGGHSICGLKKGLDLRRSEDVASKEGTLRP